MSSVPLFALSNILHTFPLNSQQVGAGNKNLNYLRNLFIHICVSISFFGLTICIFFSFRLVNVNIKLKYFPKHLQQTYSLKNFA